MKISKIEPSKHKKERILIHTEEGGLLRITERELLQFGLYAGMELPPELAKELEKVAKKSERRIYAANLASKRLISEREIARKLKDRGADEEETAEIVEWLADLGAIDDAAYAETIVRHYAAMGCGKGRVEQELYRHGIPKPLWEQALALLPDPAEAIEKFLQSKLKGQSPDRETSRKLSAALQRRGFCWNDIRAVLNQMGQEIEA